MASAVVLRVSVITGFDALTQELSESVVVFYSLQIIPDGKL